MLCIELGIKLTLDKCQLLLLLAITILLFTQSKNCKQHFACHAHVHFPGKRSIYLIFIFPFRGRTANLARLSPLIDE